MIETYVTLLKRLWLGNMSSTNPSDFKSVVETYATQFRGYEQHDSQEFFVWSCLSSHVDHAARFAA